MESLSIYPAIALMLPALGPFVLTYALLLFCKKTFIARLERRILFSDLAILSGILLVFGIFDGTSIRHFLSPDRPMDWIPLLALLIFIARTSFPRVPLILQESGTLLLSLFLLMFPLLRQDAFLHGIMTFFLTFAIWLLIRLSYPVRRAEGIDSIFLLPLLLTSSTLAFVSPLSGSLLIGQLSGGIAAVLGAMLIATWTGGPRLSAIEPGWILGALLFIGRQYVEISVSVIGCLAGALFLGAIGGRIGRRLGWNPPLRGILTAVMSVVPLAFGVLETLKSTSSQGGGY